jgi:hypothetical protein
MMSHFLYKLISPRSTFPQDMTEKETKVMQEHLTYWKDLVDRKIVVEHTVWRLLRLKMKQLYTILEQMTQLLRQMSVLNSRFIIYHKLSCERR